MQAEIFNRLQQNDLNTCTWNKKQKQKNKNN